MSMHRKYKTIEEVARRSEDDARVSNHHQANPVTVDSAFGKSAPCSGSGILGL
jgi:hypothetical protein